ncbi:MULTISPECIES: hypothetical protein [Mumia]|uniref:hypothetical protein n=1 Tax=Mumia TaxID=1546255 RepID=UPI00141E4FF3|nr:MULTISPECIES: hypothetical protein [unclassified Mumia]QMW64794.1 hypothetical protein H4N58_11080 [Mumia sp. ZJ1417]
MTVRHVGLRGALTRPAARDALLRAGEPLDVPSLLDGAVLRLREADVPGSAVTKGFAWEPTDAETEHWYPQGVTTSADAQEGATDRDVLVATWYAHHRPRRTGSRLTFVDLAARRYRHVLLVRAVRTPWGVRARPVPIHAGGIAWYGPYLYVAATRAGIVLFRISDLLRLDLSGRGRGVAGRLGYEVVLPEYARLSAWSRDEGSRLRYSFLSVAYGAPGEPPALVAGEYGGVGRSQRLWRFTLDPTTHLPVRDGSGRAVPTELHAAQSARMQGVTALDGRWYVTTSQGRGNAGDLLVGAPGDFRRHKGVLPTGCEDIAAWPERRELWSVTEWPGMRWVYAMDPDAWPGRPSVVE